MRRRGASSRVESPVNPAPMPKKWKSLAASPLGRRSRRPPIATDYSAPPRRAQAADMLASLWWFSGPRAAAVSPPGAPGLSEVAATRLLGPKLSSRGNDRTKRLALA